MYIFYYNRSKNLIINKEDLVNYHCKDVLDNAKS